MINKEKRHTIKPIELDSLGFEINPFSGVVLIEMTHDTSKTAGGILTPDYSDWDATLSAPRFGKVIKCPKEVKFLRHRKSNYMYDCDMSVREGDVVYHSYQEGLNAQTYSLKGKKYQLIRYDSIIMSIRENKVTLTGKPEREAVMHNGYILMLDHTIKRGFGVYEKEYIVPGVYDVTHTGVPNKDYNRNYDKNIRYKWTDEGIDVEKGDMIFVKDHNHVWELENYAMAVFDKRRVYLVTQRPRITAKLPKDLEF